MDRIIAILQSPLALFVVGAAVKYLPVLRTFIPNRAIPYLNMALALVGALLSLLQGAAPPPDAVPGSFTVAALATGVPVIPFSLPFFGSAVSGFLGAMQSAVTNAALAYILNKLTLNQVGTRPTDSKR